MGLQGAGAEVVMLVEMSEAGVSFSESVLTGFKETQVWLYITRPS